MPATVTVACRLPHGIWLRRFEAAQVNVLVLGGGTKEVTEYRESGERFRIKGVAIPTMRDPEVEYPLIIGGAALTYGVPADLWAAWFAANKDTAMVRNGMIFSHEKTDMVRDQAKAEKDVKSGLEPLAKDGDPRMPRRVSAAARAA